MSSAKTRLNVRGVDVDVLFKDIKHLHIGVYPPAGRVRVAAPHQLSEAQVRRAVVARLAWIRKQRHRLREAARQSQREMITGESHHVWGARYRLRLVERPGRSRVDMDGDRLVVSLPEGSTAETRRSLLDRWYREQLRAAVPDLISTWEPVLDTSVLDWRIRRMKTKWGSCNRNTGRLWFNSELAKKHPECLEYIVVHEMAHLLEGSHDDRFTGLMDRVLPDWRARRDLLNEAPLAAEEWADSS